VGPSTEEQAGGCRVQGLSDGVKVHGGKLGEAGAEVSGLGGGGGGGVATGGVEQDDSGEGQDRGKVDLTEELARGPNEWLVGPVFLETRVHAEDGKDWGGWGGRKRGGEDDARDAGVSGVFMQVTRGALGLGQDKKGCHRRRAAHASLATRSMPKMAVSMPEARRMRKKKSEA